MLSTYCGVTLAGLETDPLKELFGMCDAFYIPAQFLAMTFQLLSKLQHLTMKINAIVASQLVKLLVMVVIVNLYTITSGGE
jgi:hypothetical protein